MASSSTAGQKERKSSDALRNVSPTPVPPFEGLVMISDPAAESSSSGTNYRPYDVFITHYGQDTKYTLAYSIYEKLDSRGLRVFLDKNELGMGDFLPQALENAIATASVNIAIFSENYVKSSWCLAELAFMLQKKVKFIPIFYHVELKDLRWVEKGIYGDVFSKYEAKGRYSSETLQSWKLALHKASFYTGHIIDSKLDEEEAAMNVVNHILNELKKTILYVTRYPVGLDELEEDFHNAITLPLDGGPTQIVGISGMGGVGKTTLAKHLYNKKLSLFRQASFLFDVHDAARENVLHHKQKELLKDLGTEMELLDFESVDQGKQILRRQVHSNSVLIILDDVDDIDELDALLPPRDNLGHGSLIIVTTRNMHVLKRWGISTIYEIPPLNESYARELFCLYAFGQPFPQVKFEELVQKFVKASHGLPLSLIVLGNMLRGRRQTDWESLLRRFSALRVFDDINIRLKISFDALDSKHKEMFLDIACFFNGCERRKAIATWDGIAWNGHLDLQILIDKSFVVLDEGDIPIIRMHDHVRDLGREIALQQSPYRLWSKDRIIEIQPEPKEIRIRGMADASGDNCYLKHGQIVLNTNQGERILAPASVGLKIFIGQGDFINEECSELLRDLVLFSCIRFAHKNLPSWLLLQNLRVLELSEPQELEDLWESEKDVCLQLRLLRIHKGYGLKKINHLQKLSFLEEVIIHDCTELTTFPSLGKATYLKKFDLSRCYKLQKIESLAGLRSLETLIIYFCTELHTLPSLSEATRLKKFDLRRCYKLDKIESLEGLRSLQTLRIYDCTELDTLPSLAKLTSLKKFDLRRCNKLEKIESLQGLTSLETLIIHDCTELHSLPRLSDATALKIFDLSRCYKLEEIESLEGLRSLETLVIYYCTKLKTLPSLAEATSLKKFDLRRCKNLERIESLAGLSSLQTLRINDCTELKSLPSLDKSPSLKVNLKGCSKLSSPFSDH